MSLNLTNYQIRAEVFDISGRSLKLATANSGGADSQIKITDAAHGKFTVALPADTMYYWNDQAWIEIQMQDPTGHKFTLDKEYLHWAYRKINWNTPS